MFHILLHTATNRPASTATGRPWMKKYHKMDLLPHLPLGEERMLEELGLLDLYLLPIRCSLFCWWSLASTTLAEGAVSNWRKLLQFLISSSISWINNQHNFRQDYATTCASVLLYTDEKWSTTIATTLSSWCIWLPYYVNHVIKI